MVKKELLDQPVPFLVNGQPRQGSAEPVDSINPATGKLNHRVSSAGLTDVDEAVGHAARAASGSVWLKQTPPHRAALLHRISELIAQNADPLARLQMLENGKVWSECLAQVRSASATFRYYASVCEVLGSEITPPRGPYLSMTVHEPYGVVVAITPWNSPLTMEAQKVAPALAAGNAVILKPSELTPSPALELGRLIGQALKEAGLPAALFQVLTGPGSGVGAALVEHPGVRMVSFTGGTISGRRIAQAAAARLMPVALELGGKSPHVVFADADLDVAAEAVALGIFEGSGQSCIAGSRLFVQRKVHDQVLDRLLKRARSLRLDLPDAPGAEMGPIASFLHRDRIAAMVRQARESGAQVLAGGAAPTSGRLAAGAYYQPTVIGGIDNTADIAQQEIFGPVLCVMPFDEEEELVGLANDSAFGLAAGVWCADYRRALRVARRLDAGTVWINTYKQLSIATPFGGFKDSGLGREKGTAGLRLYQQTKGLYLGLDA